MHNLQTYILNDLLTLIAVVFLFGVLVFFHELGHFITAKLLKMKVEEFAFGFGSRKITLFKRGETEYTVHPIPLGGFVKIMGMDHNEADVPDGFMSKPWWKRFMVFFSGPIFSFVLAYTIFCLLGLFYGVPVPVNKVYKVNTGSVAQRAGLRAGDRIVKIDNERIETGKEMMAVISSKTNKTIKLVLERKGKLISIQATPKPESKFRKRGLLGFIPDQEIQRVGFAESISYNTKMTVVMIKTILGSIFSRDVAKSVGGPISIVAVTNESIKSGLDFYLRLMGLLSMSLGIINLLPIPVVDGGQMILLLAEGVKGRRLSPRTLEIAQQIGLTMLATIFILVMYLDVSRWISGTLIPK